MLIDFASTTQTWELHQPNHIESYFGLLHVLLGRRGDIALDPEFVWKYCGEPDDWDPIMASIPMDRDRNLRRIVKK